MVFWHLSDLKKPDSSLVVDDCTTLDIGLGLVGDLHDVLGLTVDHCLHDVEVDDGTQVVDVGDEDVFLSSGNELLEETGVAIDTSEEILGTAYSNTHFRASKMSPCPGGYQLALSLSDSLGHGRRDSLSTRGYRDWLKVRM